MPFPVNLPAQLDSTALRLAFGMAIGDTPSYGDETDTAIQTCAVHFDHVLTDFERAHVQGVFLAYQMEESDWIQGVHGIVGDAAFIDPRGSTNPIKGTVFSFQVDVSRLPEAMRQVLA